MASFIDAGGARQQVEMSLETIRAAKDANLSVRDYINTVYDTNAEAHGDAFAQMCASEGIVLRSDKKYGIKAPSLDAVLNGRPQIEGNVIVRNPSNQARVLLMPAIGALVEDKLVADLDMNANAFDSMVGMDTVIADEWYLWPEANFSGPEAGRSQTISQLAKPVNMMTLTTSEKSVRVPTYSLGIEYSEQATKYLNLDFIALSIARQMAVERNERANAAVVALLSGDADVGQGALSGIANKVKTAVSLDAAATAGITQLAWMLWLYGNSKKRRISHVITDINGALAIQNRTGRPIITADNGTSVRINTNERVLNPTWNDEVQVFITDDPNWPAKTIMGIDSRFAIQRVTSTNASYQAQEEFVLRRATAMRFDYGSLTRRLYNDAFEVMTYA
jgi:hypothetical protein